MKTSKFLFCILAYLMFVSGFIRAQILIPDYAINFLAGNEDEIQKSLVDRNGNLYLVGMFKSNQLIFGTDTLLRSGENDIFLVKLDADTNVVFAKSFKNWGLSKVTGIVLDSYSNIYLSGYSQGSLTFDTFILYGNSYSNCSFVVKMNPDAEVIWANSYAGGSSSCSMVIDSADNIYISGWFAQTFIINNIHTTIYPTNSNLHFLLKIDASGSEKWLKNYGGELMIDKQQNLFFTDNYSDSIRMDDHLLTTISNEENHNLYVAKADTNGHVLWAKKFCEGEHALFNNAIIDTLTNTILITGTFKTDSLTFDSHIIRNHGYSDLFIAKIDTAANVLMAKSYGSINADYSYGLTRISPEYMALLGTSNGDSIYFDNYLLEGGSANQTGRSDFFIVIIDNYGNPIWARNFPGSSGQTFQSIIADGKDNVFVAGDFCSSTDANKVKTVTSSVLTSIEPTFIEQPSLYLVKFKLGNATGNLINNHTDPISLYPNPANSHLNIKIEDQSNTFTLDIYNIEGKCMIRKALVSGINSLDIRLLPKGIYLVQVESNNNRISKKFIKN